MGLMSVSQYAKHAGISRQALYNWEARQGFPVRVEGKIDQEACDHYLKRFRDSHDQRIKNAKAKPEMAGNKLVEMSVSAIRQCLAGCSGRTDEMSPDERAQYAAKATGLYLTRGPYNPPVTFGGYRLSIQEVPTCEVGQIIAGGAFGLSAEDVVFECRDYILALMDDETEATAMREVIPSLIYALTD